MKLAVNTNQTPRPYDARSSRCLFCNNVMHRSLTHARSIFKSSLYFSLRSHCYVFQPRCLICAPPAQLSRASPQRACACPPCSLRSHPSQPTPRLRRHGRGCSRGRRAVRCGTATAILPCGTALRRLLSAEGGALYDSLDLRVGRVSRAWKHPEAEKLFVEEVDVGDAEPRQACASPLARFAALTSKRPRSAQASSAT